MLFLQVHRRVVDGLPFDMKELLLFLLKYLDVMLYFNVTVIDVLLIFGSENLY